MGFSQNSGSSAPSDMVLLATQDMSGGIAEIEWALASYSAYDFYVIYYEVDSNNGLHLNFNQSAAANYTRISCTHNALSAASAQTSVELSSAADDLCVGTLGFGKATRDSYGVGGYHCGVNESVAGERTCLKFTRNVDADVTHVKISTTGGNFVAGNIALYGIKIK
jgi:hypothetical protein